MITNTAKRVSVWIAAMLLALGAFSMSGVQAHPGPVDSDGCHLDSKGRRHCH